MLVREFQLIAFHAVEMQKSSQPLDPRSCRDDLTDWATDHLGTEDAHPYRHADYTDVVQLWWDGYLGFLTRPRLARQLGTILGDEDASRLPDWYGRPSAQVRRLPDYQGTREDEAAHPVV
jgi:hypothetical protein